MRQPQHEQVYLGDGLYADYDGLGFTLRADRDGGEHWVYLEPQVVDALLKLIVAKYELNRLEVTPTRINATRKEG